MIEGLAGYLADGVATPFAWGRCDCCTWACGWVLRQRGVDPSAALRGRYGTRRGAQRHMVRAGGLAALVAACVEAAGLTATSAPAPGDIGVVATPAGAAMAIRTGIGWAVKAERGVMVMPYRLIRAWAV